MRKKLVAALAAGGVLVGGGSAAAVFAATSSAQAAPATATATATTPAPYTHGPLGELVAKGTITQAQADAIRTAMIGYMQNHRPDFTPGSTPPALQPNGPLATVLPQLVAKGTITQAQATAVKNAVTQQVQEHWRNGTGPGGYGPGMMGGGPMGPRWAGSSTS